MNHLSTPQSKTTAEYLAFLAKFSSLQLSTIGKTGGPESSYAPFVIDHNNNFYIYVSALARHTGNMQNDGRVGIMLIEAEAEAENIFARKRVTFECDAEAVDRETEVWREIMLLFDQLATELMETLRRLTDFQLLRLRPKSGLFVKGFGKAYQISGARMDELSHVNPRK
jgi:putative heme iron utilization protein